MKINKGFIVQKMGKKITIFDGEESILYTFNETAAYIFQKLKSGWEKERIIAAVVKKYGVKEGRVRKDVEELLRELLSRRIVKG